MATWRMDHAGDLIRRKERDSTHDICGCIIEIGRILGNAPTVVDWWWGLNGDYKVELMGLVACWI